LIGPNGSGKTTTLNVISGYYVPQQGQVRLNEEMLSPRPASARASRRIARTFQTPRLVGAASDLENVMIGATTAGRASFVESLLALPRQRRDEEQAYDAAMAALTAVGLDQLAC